VLLTVITLPTIRAVFVWVTLFGIRCERLRQQQSRILRNRVMAWRTVGIIRWLQMLIYEEGSRENKFSAEKNREPADCICTHRKSSASVLKHVLMWQQNWQGKMILKMTNLHRPCPYEISNVYKTSSWQPTTQSTLYFTF